MYKYLRNLIPVLLLLGAAANAPASMITGTATDNNDLTPVGSQVAGVIGYYIPIATGADKTYGIDGGTSSDTVTLSGSTIDGAFLNMYLYFSIPTGEIGTTLSLWFKDLDLDPSNDPDGFHESLTLYGQGGLPNDVFTAYGDIDALANASASGYGTNNDSVTMDFTGLNIGSGDFWLNLGFHATSDFTSGTWKNTEEYVSAQITTTTVPEPASLVLMAIGLFSLFGLRRLQLKPIRIRNRKRRR